MLRNTKYKMLISAWIVAFVLGTGFWVYSIYFKKNAICNGIKIKITDENRRGFINEAMILDVIKSNFNTTFEQHLIKNIPLNNIENTIKKIPQADNVEVYTDVLNTLHIKVRQCEPIARVINKNGVGFYITQNAKRFELSNTFTLRVPIIVGNINAKINDGATDSVLIKKIIEVVDGIKNDKFWWKCTDQIYVNDNYDIEIVPNIGHANIVLGDEKNLDEKLNKAFVFMRDGLNKIGWDKYKKIDVQFSNQIVCSK